MSLLDIVSTQDEQFKENYPKIMKKIGKKKAPSTTEKEFLSLYRKKQKKLKVCIKKRNLADCG
jgi:hypothetical protein